MNQWTNGPIDKWTNGPIDKWTIAQLVKRVNGFEKYKKWAKLHPCFSFNKPTKQEILHFLGWS